MKARLYCKVLSFGRITRHEEFYIVFPFPQWMKEINWGDGINKYSQLCVVDDGKCNKWPLQDGDFPKDKNSVYRRVTDFSALPKSVVDYFKEVDKLWTEMTKKTNNADKFYDRYIKFLDKTKF